MQLLYMDKKIKQPILMKIDNQQIEDPYSGQKLQFYWSFWQNDGFIKNKIIAFSITTSAYPHTQQAYQ